MPDLLLELFSEEIPARMQPQAAKDLERLVVGALSDRGLLFESVRAFAGPRRLTLAISGLPAKQPDVSEEKKGPRVNAPEKAIEGFLKSAGVTLAQCEKRADPKGDFYVAVIHRKGRATSDVLAEILPDAIAKLPWPKSMRWGDGSFRWVRPLHSIIATFDGEVVPFEVAGVKSGNVTFGHRFLPVRRTPEGEGGAPGAIQVRRFEDYEKKLRAAYVIVDPAERRETILHEARQKAFALGLELIEDEGLANEVMGLAEWPVVLIGEIDAAFMDVPPEILQTSMRTHQKYFALRHPQALNPNLDQPSPLEGEGAPRAAQRRTEGRKGGADPTSTTSQGVLANRFAVVANMIASDGGKEIVAGNERVLKARLADAKFFWEQDKKQKLEERVPALTDIVFHAKLKQKTVGEKVARVVTIATRIAELLNYDRDVIGKVRRAAGLAKADLVSGVVGEFPELQGVMGRYYAIHDNEPDDVAQAIREHYMPAGLNDRVPSHPVSVCVAMADKIDTLGQLFIAGEKPTGSGDPYALRRAALGVIRILLENKLRLPLRKVIARADFAFAESKDGIVGEARLEELLSFFADRLKVALREKGVRHDLIDAVFALGDEDDLVRLVRRVEALQAFLKTDDGANLLVGYRRAANILKIEEKKDKREYREAPDTSALTQAEEKALHSALLAAQESVAKLLEREDFAGAMSEMAKLRGPVDRFFDKVTVNTTEKPGLRENRLKLLAQIVATAHQVADFSKVEG